MTELDTAEQITAKPATEKQVTREQRKIAIWANSFYIANLLLLPGLAFLLAVYLYKKHARKGSAFLDAHLGLCIKASLGAGITLLGMPLFLLIDTKDAGLWVVVLVVWTCFHGLFVLFGIYTLSRALSFKPPFNPIPNE